MSNAVYFCFCLQAVCVVLTYERQFQTEDQQFIDSLQQYEFVEPELSDALHLTTQLVTEKRLLSFSFQGQTINIQLTLNRNLLSPNFFERHVTERGYEIVNETPRNCYFHGHVEGQEGNSVAAISTCDGVEGYFTLRDKTYSIQPVESLKGEVFHIVFESEDVNLPKYKCGHSERENTVQHETKENITVTNHRVRRDVLSETKYVELVLISDKSQYTKHGSVTSSRAIAAANYVDSTYRFQNIRVILTMIEIWKDADQIVHSSSNNKRLANFIEYKKNVLDVNETTKNDHAVLITQVQLAKNYDGYAGILTICSQRSASIAFDRYSSTSIYGAIVAHELGHSFGFVHIDSNVCPCGKTICLMTRTVSYSPLRFSNCTQEKLRETLMRNYGTCLFNQPRKHYQPAKCQNGFVDEGEQCDCGTKKLCQQLGNHCCDYNTCQLYPHVNCSDGPCCENCQLKASGVMCREKVNDCDLPEYCDGKTPTCAPDSYVHNGRTCSIGKENSLCYLGVCHTYDNQCKIYWGPDGIAPESDCYSRLNVRGDVFGFCKELGNKTYMKCDVKDVNCGRLQCEIVNNTVPERHPIVGHSIKSYLDPKKTCWSASSYLGGDLPVAGMVETGSMCAENKVCYNNTCVDVNTVYEQPECPNNCSGNGICNNLGHCHCNYGYGCPHCSEKCNSSGGSVDSGNACYCSGRNISTTVATTQTLTTHRVTTKMVTTTKMPKTTEAGETTREMTTKRTQKSTEAGKTTRAGPPTIRTTRLSTEPTQSVKDEIKESNDVVEIVVPSLFGFIFLVVLPVLCFIFRKQILERCRKMSRKPFGTATSAAYRVGYTNTSNTQILRPDGAQKGLDVSLSPERDSSGEIIGEKTPGFTSISFMPVSKIDSNHAPSSPPISSLSHDVPPQYSAVLSDQSSQYSSPDTPPPHSYGQNTTSSPILAQTEVSTSTPSNSPQHSSAKL